MIRYCRECILPNTRPNLSFDSDGSCNCANQSRKQEVDWATREEHFQELVASVKREDCQYDCVIPVSGGKDSTWQVLKALEYDLRPLCVTWKTPVRTDLGARNLGNLIRLGVDHIDFSVNPKVETRFVRKTFEKLGSPVIPMHMAIHSIPLQIATAFEIPMILWGENSAYEYGGDENLKTNALTYEWLMRYGGTNGTVAEDWVDDELTLEELAPYRWFGRTLGLDNSPKAVFLGNYFEWDPVKTYEAARTAGLEASPKPLTGYYSFADVDDQFLITIHHWIKWYKFGFTRLWDNLSLEIRNGRLSRNKAIDIVRSHGIETPNEAIDEFCGYINISRGQFFLTAERFRNQEIWRRDSDGVWMIDGFLIDNWDWSADENRPS